MVRPIASMEFSGSEPTAVIRSGVRYGRTDSLGGRCRVPSGRTKIGGWLFGEPVCMKKRRRVLRVPGGSAHAAGGRRRFVSGILVAADAAGCAGARSRARVPCEAVRRRIMRRADYFSYILIGGATLLGVACSSDDDDDDSGGSGGLTITGGYTSRGGSGGSGASGGSSTSGGSGGGGATNPGDCPGTEPDDGALCSMTNFQACNYGLIVCVCN